MCATNIIGKIYNTLAIDTRRRRKPFSTISSQSVKKRVERHLSSMSLIWVIPLFSIHNNACMFVSLMTYFFGRHSCLSRAPHIRSGCANARNICGVLNRWQILNDKKNIWTNLAYHWMVKWGIQTHSSIDAILLLLLVRYGHTSCGFRFCVI